MLLIPDRHGDIAVTEAELQPVYGARLHSPSVPHARPVVHVLLAQHGCCAPPHAVHCPVVVHTFPVLHTLPAQQAWLAPPQGGVVHMPEALHTSPVLHVVALQHACPVAPQLTAPAALGTQKFCPPAVAHVWPAGHPVPQSR